MGLLMKNKVLIRIIFILVVVILITSIWIGVQQFSGSPIFVMRTFYTSYNAHDLDRLVTCLDPKIEDLYEKLNTNLTKMFGFSFNDVADLGAVLEELGLAQDTSIDPDKIDVISIQYNGSRTGDWARTLVEMNGYLGNIFGKKSELSISYPDLDTNSIVFTNIQFEYFDDFGWRIVGGAIDYQVNTIEES